MVQEKFETGMYVVDQDFQILNINDTMAQMYPTVKVGDICYRAVALLDKQCDNCPLRADDALFYNPIRKEWIHANAATMDYPGHGKCYNVQFHIRQNLSVAGTGSLQNENIDEHIRELSGGTLDVCVLGGYCAPGSPLSHANERMVKLMGYETVEEMSQDVDGLVSNTIHPDDVERVTVDLTKCAMFGGHFETTYRMYRKGHTWFWVVARGKRIQTDDGAYVLLCVITDMTEVVQRQDALRQQNEQLLKKELTSQMVLEKMPGGYHRCSNAPGWPFLYFGTSFEKITGWSREEITKKFDNLFVNMVYPEDIPLCAGIVDNVEKTGYSNAVYRIKKKGGGYIWLSDSTSKVELGEETFYHGTVADVTPHIEELEKAKQAAEASNLAKSTFLFNASHDIRTPMNAIQGFAHIIQENAHDPEIVKATVHKLQRSGQVLLTLMNDVLELSRIEQGKETVNRHPLDMQAHVEKLHEMMVMEMEHSGIQFRMENRLVHTKVFADDLKLTRIAMNFLSNARKFTPPGGTVTFGVVEKNFTGTTATYTLFVRDTGIGMSEEFQKRAFGQFEREHSSTVSGVAGSGLGLAITKKIADLVGGKLEVESQLGQGTCMMCSVTLHIAQESDFQPEGTAAAAILDGKRVLLVEDNDFNREIARYIFESLGVRVDEAENGAICIDKLTSNPAGTYDFILMDIQMPVMDGMTATKQIRRLQDPGRSRIPIVAMTANAFEEDRQKCLDVGMDGHIAKPMDAKTVLQELARVLAK